MARLTERQQIELLLEKFEPEVRAAFMDGVSEIVDRLTLKVIVERLAAFDLQGAIDAMNIDRTAFWRLGQALEAAYAFSGEMASANFPFLAGLPRQSVFRFDMRNPRAEAWIREYSSKLITRIVEMQRASVREALQNGLVQGRNPTSTALEVAGRINRVTGKREGGIIGLSDIQARSVATAREELSSGDPAKMRNFLERRLRDKRFDKEIKRMIAEGKTLSKVSVDKVVGRYSDKLLKYRADIIARTETLTSLNASAHESFKQGIEKTAYGEADVIRTWDSAGDRRVRHTHQLLDGQKRRGLDEPFRSPSGALMRFPGDTSLGAGAGEVIACRCRLRYKIDVFGEG